MADNTGGTTIIAAAIIAVAVLGSAFMLSQSIDRATGEIAQVAEAFEGIGTAAEPAAPPSRARRGPDPAKKYQISAAGAPVMGTEDATVTIVEYADFQCPFCNRVSPTLAQIQKTYGEQVRIVFKHMPLSFHQEAMGAHSAAEAAFKQGKFWEMHDKIFANQRKLSAGNYRKWAEELGLDLAQYDADLQSAAVTKRIDADKAEAAKLGVTGTPAFFVNGRFLSGAKPFADFKVLIDEEIEG